MNFPARILRYLFWVLVVSWGVRLLGRLAKGMAGPTAKSQPYVDVPTNEIARQLVRDPVCGMHLAETLAIPLREGGELVHFCSMECRDRYLNGTKKFAANG